MRVSRRVWECLQSVWKERKQQREIERRKESEWERGVFESLWSLKSEREVWRSVSEWVRLWEFRWSSKSESEVWSVRKWVRLWERWRTSGTRTHITRGGLSTRNWNRVHKACFPFKLNLVQRTQVHLNQKLCAYVDEMSTSAVATMGKSS